MKKPAFRKIRHEEPSAASLREMPEVNLKDGTWRKNPYYESVLRDGITVTENGKNPVMIQKPARMGRPKQGDAPRPTKTHAVRLTDEEWIKLTQRAKKDGVSAHVAMRAAVLKYAKTG